MSKGEGCQGILQHRYFNFTLLAGFTLFFCKKGHQSIMPDLLIAKSYFLSIDYSCAPVLVSLDIDYSCTPVLVSLDSIMSK